MRTYSELIKIPSFKDRFEYLKLNGSVGETTFSSHRYLNQQFYRSDKWLRFRNQVIIRDAGCDLAHPDFEIPKYAKLIIHHINPITIDDVLNESKKLLDFENVVCTTFMTHQAIHYGDESLLGLLNERKPNDTCPWR